MGEKFLILMFLIKYVGSEMEGFIMQGGYTDLTQYPHQVFIEIYGKEPCVCGGSILNQVIILTAAHCLEDLDNRHSKVIVMYGSENMRRMKSITVKSYMIHEHYNYESMYGDIALVRCNTPLRLGNLIKKVVILERPPQQNMGYVAGWGAMNKNFESPDILKHTKQELQSYKVCVKIGIPKGSFCAGPLHGPGNPSVGDSGGALVINRFIQIGIVSYKVHDYTLVAYTNVSYYYSWIFRNSAYLYCGYR